MQVECTVLQEKNVLVTNGFLFRQHWNRYAREAAAEHFPEEVEVAVASFAFPHALFVLTAHVVYDVTTLVLGTANAEVVL